MKFLIIIPIILAAIIAGISIYLQPNDFMGCGEQPAAGTGQCAKADAIVVVSGGDTQARTDEGIKLYENGWADTLIFSGAAQDKTGPSNAAAMRARAIQAGVNARDILIEEEAETTQENAENTKQLFADNNLQKIILVTSGYHQRRAALEFERRAEGAVILNRPLTTDEDWSGWWWATPRGWWLAGGEIVKIVVSYGLGASK